MEGQVLSLEAELETHVIRTYYSKKLHANFGTHYTSPSGFEGIIKSKKIWASRIDCLNDISEDSDIDNIYDLTLKEYIEKDCFFEKFLGIKHKNCFFDGPCNLIGGKMIQNPEIFVASFSEDDDSLCMWNYYLKNSNYEGYSIHFNFDKMEEMANDTEKNCAGYHVDQYYMLYDESEKKKLIKTLLDIILKHKNEKINIENCKMKIQRFLTLLNPICKSQYFSHEKECRMIIVQNSAERQFDLKRRSHGQYLIPYIEVPIEQFGKIEFVTCPPINNNKKISQLTEEFLSANDIYCDVRYSNIPIRY